MSRTVVIGAGPAGLTAAHELTELGRDAIVLERDRQVGGIARTASYRGYRFDIGGHRFFTKSGLVRQFWEDLLGDDFLVRPRLSRIYYDGHFFAYPLKPLDALRGLGIVESLRVLASYARAQAFPIRPERNFEEWVTNRFGRRLYEIFFQSYTEKVWGMPCTEIGAEWAAQRIKNLDLGAAIRNAVFGRDGRDGVITTLIDRFHYPRLGPGMMWERCRERLAFRGVETRLGAEVRELHHRAGRVHGVTVRRESGREERVSGDHFLSSMPLRALVEALRPEPPEHVLEAARALRYRDFLTVVLIVDRAELFPDNWIYIHSPDVRVGRIQNFKNWSPEMVPDPATTSLGLEYFVHAGDDLWSLPDAELVHLGGREVEALGLLQRSDVRDGAVVRMRHAYPVYDSSYQEALDTIRAFLSRFTNLQSIGRNGQHRYNNQDHSMLTGIYAARNVAGGRYDIWSVNEEEEYHEAVERETRSEPASSDRLVPGAAPTPSLEAHVRAAFARYDPLALGVALGLICGIGLFLQTSVLLLRGGPSPGPTLSLLGNYLFGFRVTWPGAWIGLLEAGAAGFLFGCLLARTINLVVGWEEKLLRRQLEHERTGDPLVAANP